MKIGSPLIALGLFVAAIGFALWRDGSAWGQTAGWIAAMWGLGLAAWGGIIRFYRSTLGCFAGSALAAGSVALACAWLYEKWWWHSVALPCLVAGVVAFILGLVLGVHRLGRGPKKRAG